MIFLFCVRLKDLSPFYSQLFSTNHSSKKCQHNFYTSFRQKHRANGTPARFPYAAAVLYDCFNGVPLSLLSVSHTAAGCLDGDRLTEIFWADFCSYGGECFYPR